MVQDLPMSRIIAFLSSRLSAPPPGIYFHHVISELTSAASRRFRPSAQFVEEYAVFRELDVFGSIRSDELTDDVAISHVSLLYFH